MIPKGTSERLGKEKEERKPVRGDDKQVTDEGSWDYIPLGPLKDFHASELFSTRKERKLGCLSL